MLQKHSKITPIENVSNRELYLDEAHVYYESHDMPNNTTGPFSPRQMHNAYASTALIDWHRPISCAAI